MSLALELTGLSKHYGRKQVLDSIDLSVEEGSVFGFLGPNGSGKTTTLRIMTGMARATRGSVRIFGEDVADRRSIARASFGFLPDVPAFYEWMTAEQFLRFSGDLFDMGGATLSNRIDTLLDMAGLTGVTGRIAGYSRGMKQRLGIAQALINSPRLLLLDEPTSALDPIGRKAVLDLLLALRGRTTVFFSTHLLGDVERVCDTVAILDQGRVLTQSPIHELTAHAGSQRVSIEVNGGADRLGAALLNESWASGVSVSDSVLDLFTADLPATQLAVPRMISELGLGLVALSLPERTLEDVFVELVGRSGT